VFDDDGDDTRMILFNSGNVRFDAGTLDNAFVITADTGAATFAGDITATQKKFIATSSSSGDYIRLYAASGTGKWDIYGNGANLRISDNDSAGILVVDTGASFGGTVTATLSGTATGLAGTPAISVGNITTTGYLRGPASFTIDPATHGDDTGTVVIAGNLQVDGTTTTINSTTVAIDDLNFSIATDAANSAAANGAGITIGGAGAEFAASVAILKLRSSIATVVEFIVVVVPSTCKLPAITTVPVSSPCVAGSIVKLAGPLKYPVVVMLPTLIAGVPAKPVAVPDNVAVTVPPKLAPVSTTKIPALSLSLILKFAPFPYISHFPVPLAAYNLI
jgi:hypothetical protein